MKIRGSIGLWTISAVLLTVGCAAGPAPDGGVEPRSTPTAPTRGGRVELPPSGHGTLRQDAVTVQLRLGDLLIKTTPLEESVTRMTAPDTYQRLSGLVAAHRAALEQQAFTTDLSFFFVSFFSYEANIPFVPEDLLLTSQGLRFRPLAIQSVTPGFDRRRLNQQETQMAIYAFETGIDLDVDLVVQYQTSRSSVWGSIIPIVQSERSKVVARAGPSDTTETSRR